MILFPEGGFLRKRKAVSQEYARKNNLAVLENVTLPRVGALHAIISTIGAQGVANNNSLLDSGKYHCFASVFLVQCSFFNIFEWRVFVMFYRDGLWLKFY